LVELRELVRVVEGLAVGDDLLGPLQDGVALLDPAHPQRAVLRDARYVRLLVQELQLSGGGTGLRVWVIGGKNVGDTFSGGNCGK